MANQTIRDLEQIRTKLGLTQKAFSTALGYSHSMYGQVLQTGRASDKLVNAATDLLKHQEEALDMSPAPKANGNGKSNGKDHEPTYAIVVSDGMPRIYSCAGSIDINGQKFLLVPMQ